MKKVFVVCLLCVFAVPVFAEKNWRFSANLDIAPTIKPGLTMDGRYLFLGNDDSVFRMGAGILHAYPRSSRDEMTRFYPSALYLTVQTYLLRGSAKVYLKGNFGISELQLDLDTIDTSDYIQLYCGAGVGIEFGKRMFAELVYHEYAFARFGAWFREKPTHVSFGLGMRF
jgi:hypothetical protein